VVGVDDRDRRHFRTGAGRGRREQKRQPLALGETDAVDVVEPVRRPGEIGDELGGVERAAAPDRQDEVDPAGAAGFHRGFTCDGGSATTSSKTVTSIPAADNDCSASLVNPAPRTPLSVTSMTRRAS
jgi:hypothetical protein